MTSRQLSTPSREEERSLNYSGNHKPSSVSYPKRHQRYRSTPDSICFEQTRAGAIATQGQTAKMQPQFHLNQRVYFIGGCGTVKNCQPYAQTWTYAVEMELGPEPEMGRIGYEATILLNESEIQGLVDAA